jgi:hypothetical protein
MTRFAAVEGSVVEKMYIQSFGRVLIDEPQAVSHEWDVYDRAVSDGALN